MSRSVKAQMKYANKLNARFSAVVGDDDIKNGKVMLKNMETGESEEIDFSNLADQIKR